jgi:hypothetical protein
MPLRSSPEVEADHILKALERSVAGGTKKSALSMTTTLQIQDAELLME